MGLRKIFIKLLNVVYLAGAATSIVALCTQPLVNINVSATVSGEAIGNLIIDDQTTTAQPTSFVRGAPTTDFSKYLSAEDLKDLPNITIPVDVSVPVSAAFNLSDPNYISELVFNKETGVLHTSIANAADSVADQFVDVVEKVGTIAATGVFSDAITSQLEAAGSTLTEEQTKILEDNLSEIVGDLFEALNESEDGLSSSEVMNLLLGEKNEEGEYTSGIGEALDELKEVIPALENFDLSEDIDEEQIQEQIEEVMKAIPGLAEENEEGELVIKNMDEALAALLDYFLGSNDNPPNPPAPSPDPDPEEELEEEVEEEVPTKAFVVMAEDSEAADRSKTAQKLIDIIEGFIPEDVWTLDLSLGGFTPMILLGVIILAMLPWAIFALITVIRTLRRKKCWTKVWVIFTFAFLELILGVVLTIGLNVAVGPLSQLVIGLIPNTEGVNIASLLVGLNFGIQTTAFIPSIVYLAMIPFTIFYMVVCHKEKKAYKEAKRKIKADKKAAKAA